MLGDAPPTTTIDQQNRSALKHPTSNQKIIEFFVAFFAIFYYRVSTISRHSPASPYIVRGSPSHLFIVLGVCDDNPIDGIVNVAAGV